MLTRQSNFSLDMNPHTDHNVTGRRHTHVCTSTDTCTHTHYSYVYKKVRQSKGEVNLLVTFCAPLLNPLSPSPQPLHLINGDSQLTQARITNLFQPSPMPLMTPVCSATYLYPCFPETPVSSFLCLESKLMRQHL